MYSVQKSFTSKAVEQYESFSQSSKTTSSFSSSSLQKSRSEILSNRGYKPSDVNNPQAKEYLTNLSKRHFRHTDENRTKKIDLQKLFTPSNDFEEIKPGKNRKLYASSAFFTPGIHPTVEDQVELARRISHSLSDISNQKSKGQSMYINRKKRSVKWVHDVNGKDISSYAYEGSSKIEDGKEEKVEKIETSSSLSDPKKVPLKFVMNPQGQRDFFESEPVSTKLPLMSPEPIINALNTPKEKGAELFAKRRKKSDKWIIDDTNSEKILKSSSMKAANFMEQTQQSTIESISKSITDMKPITPITDAKSETYIATSKISHSPTIIPYSGYSGLAYRPRVAQGWNAPPIKLQAELDDKMMDEDKENTLPPPPQLTEQVSEMLRDEQEIMDIYEDSSRHIEFINDKGDEDAFEEILETEFNKKEIEPQAVILDNFPETLNEFKKEMGFDDQEEEEEEEYTKVSVKDLVSTFESFQHKEKVHLRKNHHVIIKEPSTESDISEVPKLIQLFTGQQLPASAVSETPPTAVEQSPPRKLSVTKEQQLQQNNNLNKSSKEKVSCETQTPTSSFINIKNQANDIITKNTVVVKSSDSKLEETISEFECQIQNMFEQSTDQGKIEQAENFEKIFESNGPTLAPLTVNTEIAAAQDSSLQLLLQQPKLKCDAMGNVSPLPYLQNTQPLPPDLNINIPEPEPPKPDYSYEAFLSNPQSELVEIPATLRQIDLASVSNYNTAPRGWGLAKDYYRPIHMGKKFDSMIYSDF